MRMTRGLRASFVLFLLAACRHQASVQGPPAAPTPAAAYPWARATLARLSVAEKAAQMIGVRVAGLYRKRYALNRHKLAKQLAQLLDPHKRHACASQA